MGIVENFLQSFTPEAIDKVIDKGFAAAETNGRKRLPDAGILAGAGILVLLLSTFLFYWGKLK